MYRFFIVTIFDFRDYSYKTVHATFKEGQKVTLLTIRDIVVSCLQREDFMLIAWSQVDEYDEGVQLL